MLKISKKKKNVKSFSKKRNINQFGAIPHSIKHNKWSPKNTMVTMGHLSARIISQHTSRIKKLQHITQQNSLM